MQTKDDIRPVELRHRIGRPVPDETLENDTKKPIEDPEVTQLEHAVDTREAFATLRARQLFKR